MTTAARRYGDIEPSTDVCFDLLPQTAMFGKGWVVSCSSDPLPLLQTPKMRAPIGCLDGAKPKLSLALAVDDPAFQAWYEGLEEHVIGVVEQSCDRWFGKPAAEVQPSVRAAFFSCMQPDDLRPETLLTLSVPTRGSNVMVAFYAADGSATTHAAVQRNQEVACHIELEGLWFANQRWGLRWRLTNVKCYGIAAEPSDFAFVVDDDDEGW